MTRAASRRLRSLRYRTGLSVLRGEGHIAWSTDVLIGPRCRIRLAPGAVIRGQGLVSMLSGSSLELAERVAVMRGAEISLGEGSMITIGRDTYVGSYANLRVDGELHIGADVLIAQFVSVISGQYDHRSSTAAVARVPTLRGVTRVADGAWIGANAVILSGVTVGSGAVVGAGSIVTHDVEPLSIVAGNPARVIGERGRMPS